MKIQFNERELSTGKYLPVGRHPVKVTGVKVGTSQNSGGQILNIELRGIGEMAGKEAMETISLSEKARWRVATLCKACGFTDEILKSGQFDTQMLIGKSFMLDKQMTGVKMFNGQEKKQYQSAYEPLPENEPQPSDSHEPAVGAGDPAIDDTFDPTQFPNFS